jgi:transposase
MNTIEELKEIISKQQSIIDSQAKIIESLRTENTLLHQKVNYLVKKYFGGNKSEKLDLNQIELFEVVDFSEPSGSTNYKNTALKNNFSDKNLKKKDRKIIRSLPDNIPEKEEILIPEEVEKEPDAYRFIGEERTVELDIQQQQLFKRVIVRKKYVRKDSPYEPPIIEPLPPRLIEKSIASPGLLTHIILLKYLYHLPLYRIEKMFKEQYGVELTRKVMSHWLALTSNWLKLIYHAMKEEIKKHGYLQIDETPVKYLSELGSRKGFFWVYTYPKGNRIYEWHTGRAHTCLKEMLKDFKGIVHSDGFRVYDKYFTDYGGIILLLCWAHARRKFYEAIEESPGEANWFLIQIQNLYRIETRLNENHSPPKIREIIRQSESAMILNRIKKALDLKLLKHTRNTSLMHVAITYAHSRWEKLVEYIYHGIAEIDNNGVERAIRPTAIGKKNWLFIGHPEAGEKSAILYSIIETCRAYKINPGEYLKDVLSKLPTMKNTEVHNYTPSKWLERKNSVLKVA